MKTQILVTDEYSEWFGSLDATEKKAVRRVVGMLEQMGVTLPFPYSSSLKNTSHPLRELRVKAKGTQIRVVYGFDPTRNALLLIGATKAGCSSGQQRPEANASTSNSSPSQRRSGRIFNRRRHDPHFGRTRP